MAAPERALILPVEAIRKEGTHIDFKGHDTVRANREANKDCGLPPVVLDRIPKAEPIAIVGYGPSLKETWPRLRDYRHVWTTSKAHSFLIENGITPTAHVDLDMRAHKAEFMDCPQPGVKYMLATHVHPSYVEKMKAAKVDVSMFHVAIEGTRFSKARGLDERYPQFRVCFDVGIQAAEIAFRDGFYDQHWFGIEYGIRGLQTHAGLHWGIPQTPCKVSCGGQVFETSNMFLQGLLLAEEFLCTRAKVRCTIHGDGLLGHFLRCRGRAPRVKYVI